MTASLSRAAVVAVVVVLAGLAVAVDLVIPSASQQTQERVMAGPAVAGAWYCAAGSTQDGSTVRYYAATPRTVDGSPAEVTTAFFQSGTVTARTSAAVFPFTSVHVDAAPDLPNVAAGVRWFGQPAAVTRSWQVQGAGLPSGLVEGPCAPGPSTSWFIPGMTTAGGAQAEIHVTNPFATDSSIAVRMTSPDGEIAPVLLENLLVAARSSTVIQLNDHAPEQSDLGVVVTARSGRVVTEGVQFVSAAIGGIDGVSLVRATPRLAETWTVPFAIADPVVTDEPDGEPTDEATDELADEPTGDEGGEAQPAPPAPLVQVDQAASWVWVSNPNPESAAVSLAMHTEVGLELPDLGEELTVPANGQLRIDLGPLLPDGARATGVTIRSENGVAVAVSAASVVQDGGGRTGLSIQRGDTSPDTVYILTGAAAPGRRQFLDLVNPGGDPAVVDVSLFNGITVLRPAELQGLEVAPGGLLVSELGSALEAAEEMTAIISVRQGSIVAGRHAFDREGTLDWVVSTGVTAGLWRGGEVVPVVRHDATLTRRLGTAVE
jgi:hypothetical protein